MVSSYLKDGKYKNALDRFEFCEGLLNEVQAGTFAEIGVWKGEFAAYILKNCLSIETYYMIDPWRFQEKWNKPANVPNDRFEVFYNLALSVTDFAADRRVVKRQKTQEAVKTIPDNYFDAVYIDGDHTLRGIALDLMSVYSKVKNGGVILGDDFSPTIWQHSREYEPSFVFPFAVHFAEAKGCPIYAGPYNQFVIIKRPEFGYQFYDLTGGYPETEILSQFLQLPTLM